MNEPADPKGWGRPYCHECEEHHDPWDMEPRDPFRPQRRCLSCARRDKQEAYRRKHYPANRKPCDDCGELLPFDAFYKKGRARCGLESVCQDCKKKQRDDREERSRRQETQEQIDTEGTRTCEGRCKRTKPLEDFEKRTDGLGGRRAVCKDCRNVEKRLRRLTKKRARAELRGLVECWLCREHFPSTHVVKVDAESYECHDCREELDG